MIRLSRAFYVVQKDREKSMRFLRIPYITPIFQRILVRKMQIRYNEQE